MSGISIRLISSVAVVGRDNEPIYLRGDLCNVTAASFDLDKLIGDDDECCSEQDETSVQDADAIISVQLGGTQDNNKSREESNPSSTVISTEDDSDPFGFFTENSHAMSLTNQLVLHASLDRFEEMARSSNGAVRWRMPGSNGANAMWMGRLCEVEERWNVYGECLCIGGEGYLTNTGIKFMIIVENVQINEDGIQIDHTPTLFAHQSSHREADLKNMFVSSSMTLLCWPVRFLQIVPQHIKDLGLQILYYGAL
eukprot:scaffold16521_cov66-Cyclotella_meneghiniana.AAC.13